MSRRAEPTAEELELIAEKLYSEWWVTPLALDVPTWENLDRRGRDHWALIAAVAFAEVRKIPVPMRLPCEKCGAIHVDGKLAETPHHTHACQSCGAVWRPAIVPTVGVQFLPGYRDKAAAEPAATNPLPRPAASSPATPAVVWYSSSQPTHVYEESLGYVPGECSICGEGIWSDKHARMTCGCPVREHDPATCPREPDAKPQPLPKGVRP